ncbi:hypothetical protein PGT21_002518 [Puccinia graminis f. sp. tritici]|uniref:Uncharacterized protein n=1 Tax=Puccinia graminis f. sp. tritici TaxID=56615 RepID=A0A5B0NYX7_PUCGR|nr:hypothetical protein PGT21_002518 [Puccinia graminis f. sp. tritici]KAA1129981.1 hypothetical protein PGTUg99_005885 [Puccinia graminis f. sp. tritici]
MSATTWAILFEDYIVNKQPIPSKHMSVDTTRIDSTGMSLRHKISVTCESQSPTKLITALLALINRGPLARTQTHIESNAFQTAQKKGLAQIRGERYDNVRSSSLRTSHHRVSSRQENQSKKARDQ